MKSNIERRQCQRFEIPEAHIRYKKGGLWKLISPLSQKTDLVNISKGGVCFKGKENIPVGGKITVSLHLPYDICRTIKGTVVWKKGDEGSGYMFGVKFAAYKRGFGYNHPDLLNMLRALEAIYLNPQPRLRRVA